MSLIVRWVRKKVFLSPPKWKKEDIIIFSAHTHSHSHTHSHILTHAQSRLSLSLTDSPNFLDAVERRRDFLRGGRGEEEERRQDQRTRRRKRSPIFDAHTALLFRISIPPCGGGDRTMTTIFTRRTLPVPLGKKNTKSGRWTRQKNLAQIKICSTKSEEVFSKKEKNQKLFKIECRTRTYCTYMANRTENSLCSHSPLVAKKNPTFVRFRPSHFFFPPTQVRL